MGDEVDILLNRLTRQTLGQVLEGKVGGRIRARECGVRMRLRERGDGTEWILGGECESLASHLSACNASLPSAIVQKKRSGAQSLRIIDCVMSMQTSTTYTVYITIQRMSIISPTQLI